MSPGKETNLRIRLALLLLFVLASFGFAQPMVDVTDDFVTGKSATITLNMSSSDANMGTAPALASIQLIYRCNHNGLEIYLRADDWKMFAGYPADIVYRFSNGDPTSSHRWSASTNGMAVFLPSSHNRQFLNDSFAADELAVRWTLAGGPNKTLVYDLAGFNAVGEEHLASCR